MKKILLIFTFSIAICNLIQAQTREEFEQMLAQINSDSLRQTVMDMQSFRNRYCGAGNKEVAQYVVGRLQSYGVANAAVDSFLLEVDPWFGSPINRYMYNVKGTVTGSGQTDSTIIIGAHLDAISFYEGTYTLVDTATAGADDNASGIAVMLEMARIMHLNNLTPRLNISFMGFDAEEVGLYGGYHDAQVRSNAGESIAVMLNNDMVANQPETDEWTLTLHWYDNATDIVDKAAELCEEFTTITPYLPTGTENNERQQSDSWAYAQQGFKALFSIEYYFSSYYHTLLDSYEYCNFDYTAEVAKMNFAMLFNYAFTDVMALDIKDFSMSPNSVKLYPNPATDYVNLHLPAAVLYNNEVGIYDIYGKLCKTFTMNELSTRIQVSDLVSGVYFIRLQNEQGAVINTKFVKM
jgi:aminopeptidase YwaD